MTVAGLELRTAQEKREAALSQGAAERISHIACKREERTHEKGNGCAKKGLRKASS